jgi:poly(3-hydroxybutyrate) depolymerase
MSSAKVIFLGRKNELKKKDAGWAREPWRLVQWAALETVAASATAQYETIEVNGRTRYFLRSQNAQKLEQGAAVLFGFHGGATQAASFRDNSGFLSLIGEASGDVDNVAEADDVSTQLLLVFPLGTCAFGPWTCTWNVGWCCGNAMRSDSEDDAFFEALLDFVLDDVPEIDPRKVLLTGPSNGGFITHRLAATFADRVLAAAPVIAQAGGYDTDVGEPYLLPPADTVRGSNKGVSVHMINGGDDRYVPNEGGKPDFPKNPAFASVSSAESIAFWTQNQRNCTGPVRTVTDGGTVEHEAYVCGDGNGGTRVEFTLVTDMQHVWPGAKRVTPGEDRSDRIDGTEVIWRFFQEAMRGLP